MLDGSVGAFFLTFGEYAGEREDEEHEDYCKTCEHHDHSACVAFFRAGAHFIRTKFLVFAFKNYIAPLF